MTSSIKVPAYCVEYFYAKAHSVTQLKNELLKLQKLTLRESGCLQYDLLQDKTNSNLFILLVKFRDSDTMSQHEQQPYIKAFAAGPMLEFCEKVIWNDAVLLTTTDGES